MKTLLKITLTTMLLVFAGCGPSALPHFAGPHKQGLSENPQRLKLGMRAIGSTWICFRSTEIAGDEWIIDASKDIAAVKNVRRDQEGNAMRETDVYISGKKYLSEDGGDSHEELRVSCDWSSEVIELAYLGDDPNIRKWVEKLPPFSSATKAQYVDLVRRIALLWGQVGP